MVQEDVRRQYVDFAYYKNDYGGTQIKTENDFKRAESISEAFVNHVWPDCKAEFGYRLN